MTTTTKSLTAQQIRDLRKEAEESGEDRLFAVCELALNGSFDMGDYSGLDHKAIRGLPPMSRDVSRMTQDEAYAEIVDYINGTYRSVGQNYSDDRA